MQRDDNCCKAQGQGRCASSCPATAKCYFHELLLAIECSPLPHILLRLSHPPNGSFACSQIAHGLVCVLDEPRCFIESTFKAAMPRSPPEPPSENPILSLLIQRKKEQFPAWLGAGSVLDTADILTDHRSTQSGQDPFTHPPGVNQPAILLSPAILAPSKSSL